MGGGAGGGGQGGLLPLKQKCGGQSSPEFWYRKTNTFTDVLKAILLAIPVTSVTSERKYLLSDD